MKKQICALSGALFASLLSISAVAGTPHTDMYPRPVPMGVSIGNTSSAPFIYAGTAGMRVHPFGAPGLKMILSNNHVLGAGGPNLCPNEAPQGTWTLQPGTLDIGFDPGNNPSYLAGIVWKSVPLVFGAGGVNTVDAAVAFTRPEWASARILEVGYPNPQLGIPAVGMNVIKSGRTTGLTGGIVTAVNASVNVNYGAECGVASFVNQVITSAGLGDSGDSGSVVLETATRKPVGLYFAGSPSQGVMNPILSVYQALQVFVDSPVVPATSGGAQMAKSVTSESLVAQAAAASNPVIERLKKVQARHEKRLFDVEGVVGVGIGDTGDGELGLVVYAKKASDRMRKRVGKRADDARIRIIESGEFQAH